MRPVEGCRSTTSGGQIVLSDDTLLLPSPNNPAVLHDFLTTSTAWAPPGLPVTSSKDLTSLHLKLATFNTLQLSILATFNTMRNNHQRPLLHVLTAQAKLQRAVCMGPA